MHIYITYIYINTYRVHHQASYAWRNPPTMRVPPEHICRGSKTKSKVSLSLCLLPLPRSETQAQSAAVVLAKGVKLRRETKGNKESLQPNSAQH